VQFGARISIEVVYALPQRAVSKTFRLETPATIRDALRAAASDPDFAGIDVTHSTVGVFGKVATAEQILNNGDRVEIYRALAADPKLARRIRAKEARRKP
jgi:uncharacterized protein